MTPETGQLVASVEAAQDTDPGLVDVRMSHLVEHLAARCAEPAVRARYKEYANATGVTEAYPLDADGYAQTFDPLQEETELFEAWQRYGVAVGSHVVPDKLCVSAVQKVHDTLQSLSDAQFYMDQPDTFDAMPIDSFGVPILSRGFFEVYHDDVLAQLRQSLHLYLHHVILWGQADLWTTFDRFGVKLPGHIESAALPLHVDQNPNFNPGFTTTQGVVALEDCPAERGTLRVAPGSKNYFAAYGRMAIGGGQYVELKLDDPVAEVLTNLAAPLPIRKGSVASWDSRTTHANSANISEQPRFVALISAGPAQGSNRAAVTARDKAFETGAGINVRGALMHASRRPRYSNESALAAIRQPERLSLLGKLLYGQVQYGHS
ncbi:MAG TPA: phytanoyl-CoA dioxygenase family protein [Candidatus Saccharimonadales bacterium]|nr:phytanoyl-CoA dioxygenase family protein [Candidatus Saccharimonadales bacterium]